MIYVLPLYIFVIIEPSIALSCLSDLVKGLSIMSKLLFLFFIALHEKCIDKAGVTVIKLIEQPEQVLNLVQLLRVHDNMLQSTQYICFLIS